MKRIDPAEQGLVHENPVPVLGRERRELALDLLDRVVGVRAGEEMEDVVDARVSASPARFERVDGVGEGRLGGIGGDGGDLGLVRGEGAREGRQEMLRRDSAERRNAEGPGPVVEQGVGAGGFAAAAAWLCWFMRLIWGLSSCIAP